MRNEDFNLQASGPSQLLTKGRNRACRVRVNMLSCRTNANGTGVSEQLDSRSCDVLCACSICAL